MDTTSDAARHRAADLAMRERLLADFGAASAGHVLATIGRCHDAMRRVGLHGDELIAATESMARSRLAAETADAPLDAPDDSA